MTAVSIFVPTEKSAVNFRGDLIREMLQNGYKVTLCIGEVESSVSQDLRSLGVNGIIYLGGKRAKISPINDLKFIHRIRRVIIAENPDIVLAYTIKNVIFVGLVTRFFRGLQYCPTITGLGYVFTGDGSIKVRIIRWIVLKLYRFALKNARLVFFQNPDDRNYFQDLNILGFRTRAVVVNGSGVNISKYVPSPFPSSVVFGMVGRLLFDKGIREFCEAAEIVKKKYPTVSFRVAGAADSNPSSLSPVQIQAIRERGVVELIGHTDDIGGFISNCSVFVLPSYREGLPRSSLEAMAMGRPIITTNVPGCKETVIEGINGYIVEPFSAHELATAMEKFISRPESIPEMGVSSRALAAERFDVVSVNKFIRSQLGLR